MTLGNLLPKIRKHTAATIVKSQARKVGRKAKGSIKGLRSPM